MLTCDMEIYGPLDVHFTALAVETWAYQVWGGTSSLCQIPEINKKS